MLAPLAVVGGAMYSNVAGVIPVVQALLGKGAALGTVLAFMMAVIGLSLPEAVILRKVLALRLLVTFIGVVATSVTVTPAAGSRLCDRPGPRAASLGNRQAGMRRIPPWAADGSRVQ